MVATTLEKTVLKVTFICEEEQAFCYEQRTVEIQSQYKSPILYPVQRQMTGAPLTNMD